VEIADLQSYPGYIEVVGWEGKELIFKIRKHSRLGRWGSGFFVV
jgi:hypothetical protein